jgi:hypothetical protein
MPELTLSPKSGTMNLAKVHLAKEDSMKRKTKVIIIHIFGKSTLFENLDTSCLKHYDVVFRRYRETFYFTLFFHWIHT